MSQFLSQFQTPMEQSEQFFDADQTYVSAPLSGNYSELDKEKLQRMVYSAIKDVEAKFEQSRLSEGREQTIYLTEPRNAGFSEANRIKCIVYSYTPEGNVTYGACVFRRNNLTGEFSEVASNQTGGSVASAMTTRSASRRDVFKKKNIRATALKRYTEYPVTFSMDFKELYVPVKKTVSVGGKFVSVTENVLVTREEQVLTKIKQMMCDKVNGGVSSRSRVRESKGTDSDNASFLARNVSAVDTSTGVDADVTVVKMVSRTFA